ncbi:hypothetical protein [Tepidimicrobium xylanilyticum]|uniref:hypothetical protein n=1 Tax=Tepidimicrobium xylanilyticum TaxID=1123352 RepID=UPI000B83F4F3|nr:hypothetical protein [Tepidimicrobium xylanilyticum]
MDSVAKSVEIKGSFYYFFWITFIGTQLLIDYSNYEYYKFMTTVRTVYLAIYFILVLSSYVYYKLNKKDSKNTRNYMIILGVLLVSYLFKLSRL